MIKVLDSTKTLTQLVADQTNGLGILNNIVGDALVTEELNGIYELEFSLLTSDKHYEDLINSKQVKCPVNEAGSEQIFDVYYISTPINGLVKVKAQHCSYRAAKISVEPFSATGAVNVKNALISHTIGSYEFNTWTDITNSTSVFTLNIPRSLRECLGGYEGSILDVFRPEYEWDNLTIKMHARRGSDHGVRISYGKNLTDFTQEENNQSVYDAVLGYAVVDEVTYVASSIYNKTGATYPKVKNVDFSSKYESGDVPTAAELLAYATSYATNNDIEVPNVNIKIKFVPLYQTEEYKNIAPLERVFLGDTVHVYFDKLGVEASSRVIKTVWNVLLNRYEEIELGNAKANLNTVINNTVQDAVDNLDIDLEADVGYLETRLDDLTSLIANGIGLHITKDGAGRYILHNDESLANSKYQYMISAQGFMMSDDYGITWNSGWTTSGDAVMNSLSTITLNALEIVASNINGSYIYGTQVQGSQIIFGDPNDTSGKYIIAQQYDADSDGNYDGVSFDGTGYVRFQPQEQFIVNNQDSNGNVLNKIVLSKSGANNQPYLVLQNYDDTQNFLTANFIELDAHYSSTPYNRTVMTNYATASGTQYIANYFGLFAYEDYNYLYLYNYATKSSNPANRLRYRARSTSNDVFLENYKLESSAIADPNNDGFANRIMMTGVPLSGGGTNSVYINNYDVDSERVANQIYMTKSTSSNRIQMNLYRGGNYVGYISISRTSDSSDALGIDLVIQSNSTYGYKSSQIHLKSDGTIKLNGSGVYFNGTQKW